MPPHIIYKTCHQLVLEAETIVATASNTAFKIDDQHAAGRGMKMYRSWADECDSQTIQPKHGTHTII